MGEEPTVIIRTAKRAPLNLTTQDLASRWGMNPGSLANARMKAGQPHPAYFRTPGGRVLYPLPEVEAFEAARFVPARDAAA